MSPSYRLPTTDVLPILFLGLDSPTHSIQDAALNTLNIVLPVLDFSTIKNDLFPAVAHVFSKTSSMAIKIRGLEAFSVLCGGSALSSNASANDLMPAQSKPNSSSAVLDKYTIQEKVVPLLKVIKTKEPAVMVRKLDDMPREILTDDTPDGSTASFQTGRQSCRHSVPCFGGVTLPVGILPGSALELGSVPRIHGLDQASLDSRRAGTD